MIHPALKIFEGTISPSVHLGVIYLRAPVTGTIKNVYLNLDDTVETDALFNIRQNGVALWSGSGRLTVPGGTGAGSKTALNIAVTKGDTLILDLEVPPAQSGKVGGNFSLLIEIDDGVPTWTTEQLQDLVAAMMISGTNSSWIYDDAAGTLRVDAPQLTDEEVQDKIGALLSGGANTTVTYNDGANTLVIAETTAGKTQEEIEDIVAALLQQGSNVTLTYNDGANQLTIAASGGGSGGITGHPDNPPNSANSHDDEFNGSSLDAKWTVVNQSNGNGFTPSVGNGALLLAFNAEGASTNVNLRGIRQNLSYTSTFKITAKLSVNTWVNSSDHYAYIFCQASSSGNGYSTRLNIASSSRLQSRAIASDSSVFGTLDFDRIVSQGLPSYLRIEYDGTNLISSVSWDGQHFSVMFSVLKTNRITGTIDRFGIAATGYQGNAYQVCCDWIRVIHN